MGRINIAEIRRRQIVDAAIRVMAEKGWNDTSIDEITREAGVSRGLVSYHFRDKADLLSSMLARCSGAAQDVVTEAIEATPDPVERLRVTIRASLNLTREDPAIYDIFLHFMASGRSNPELGQQIRELYSGFRRGTAISIAHGQRIGLFRNDIDPAAAAARHIGAMTGFALQWLLDPGAFPFEDAARQTEDMLIDYLVTGPKSGSPENDPAADKDMLTVR
ncbi:MAG: TetR/AcrR family transcriptional regulator [Dehalococcoidia bacterium]